MAYVEMMKGKQNTGPCTNEFHWQKNSREGLNLVPKILEELEYEFPFFETFRPEKQGHHFRCSVTPRNSSLKRPQKSRVPFTYKLDFPENVCTR